MTHFTFEFQPTTENVSGLMLCFVHMKTHIGFCPVDGVLSYPDNIHVTTAPMDTSYQVDNYCSSRDSQLHMSFL